MRMKMKPSGPIPYGDWHGRVGVAIDFGTHIHNFKGHEVDGPCIFVNKEYCLFSSTEHIITDKHFFGAKFIDISFADDSNILLEDYAYEWIRDPKRKWADFYSKD